MLNYAFTFLDKFKKDYKDAKKKNPTLDTDFEEFLKAFDPALSQELAVPKNKNAKSQ